MTTYKVLMKLQPSLLKQRDRSAKEVPESNLTIDYFICSKRSPIPIDPLPKMNG